MLASSVNWTPVPETPVDKHGDPGSGKDNIGLAAQVGERPPVDEVAQAPAMQFPTQSELRSRVAASQAAHLVLDGWTRGKGIAPTFGHGSTL